MDHSAHLAADSHYSALEVDAAHIPPAQRDKALAARRHNSFGKCSEEALVAEEVARSFEGGIDHRA